MQNIHFHRLIDNMVIRLDHDEMRNRFIFRLIDADSGETVTTRIYSDQASAQRYYDGWLVPCNTPVSIML